MLRAGLYGPVIMIVGSYNYCASPNGLCAMRPLYISCSDLDCAVGSPLNIVVAMNYAFHIDLSDMAYETWHMMYTKPKNAESRAGWWGPEHIGQSGPNSALILA